MKAPAAVETAEIESLDQEGRGVTHVGGKAVFVDGALPGEQVSFRRTKRQRRHDEAEVLYQRALATVKNTLGPDHPNVAAVLENMARFYRNAGRPDEAESLEKQANAIRSRTQ